MRFPANFQPIGQIKGGEGREKGAIGAPQPDE